MSDPAILGVGAAACVALMSVLWAIGRRIDNWSIVDPGWASCLVLLAWLFAALSDGAPLRRVALASAVTLWGGRHAWLLLAHRVIGHPEEGRYVKLRERWGAGAFFLFFQAQALLAVLLSGPFLLVCGHAGGGPLPLEVAALVLFPLALAPIHFPEHMALKIERSHHFKTDDLRARLEQIRLELHDDLGIEAEWKGDTIHFHKLGVTGNVTYTPDRVQIVAKIPFFVPLSEKTLREEIEKRLDHYLRPPEADAA